MFISASSSGELFRQIPPLAWPQKPISRPKRLSRVSEAKGGAAGFVGEL